MHFGGLNIAVPWVFSQAVAPSIVPGDAVGIGHIHYCVHLFINLFNNIHSGVLCISGTALGIL